MYAAEAFSNLADAEGAARLVEALAPDQEVSIRLYAAWTPGPAGRSAGPSRPDRAACHEDSQIRMRAAWTLGQLGNGAGIRRCARRSWTPPRPCAGKPPGPWQRTWAPGLLWSETGRGRE